MAATPSTPAKDARSTAVPRLRFPEFRGKQGWKYERMTKLYSFMRTNTFSWDALNYENGTVKNIHYGDIHTKFPARFDITKERVPFINETEELPEAAAGDYCIEGDLIFADASEDKHDVGKSIEIVRLNGERLLSGQHTILARRNDDALIVGFGAHLFRSGQVRSQIQREAQGTKVYAISSTRLRNIAIAYPGDKAEQQKIANCLTSLDDLVAAQGRKVESLKDHKRGLMQHLFPREGETRPRYRFPAFRDGPDWVEAQLGDVFETMTGGTPDRGKKEYWNGSIPWITTSLLDFNVITQAEEFITESGLENSSAKIFPKGTVLVALYGQGKTRGKVGVLGIDAATNQACGAIMPGSHIDPLFTFANLSGRYEELRALSNSGGQENLSQGLVRSLPFRYPKDPEEQIGIVGCLSSLDAQIAAESETIDALNVHKKGLMQQLFPATSSPERN
jgi:type I restriction enzyme S subunit